MFHNGSAQTANCAPRHPLTEPLRIALIYRCLNTLCAAFPGWRSRSPKSFLELIGTKKSDEPLELEMDQSKRNYLHVYLGKDINSPVLLDNLIHKGEIPVIIGLFIEPGDKGPGNSDLGRQRQS